MVEGIIMSKFDDFWAIYPRKKEKKRARVSFNRLPKKTQSECIDGVKKYIKQIEIQGTEPQFIKHPSTFMHEWVIVHPAIKMTFTISFKYTLNKADVAVKI